MIETLVNSGGDDATCRAAATGDGTGVDEVLRGIRSAIADNVTCLGLCLAVVVVAALVLWYVLATVWAILTEWRRLVRPPLGGAPPPPRDAEDARDDVPAEASLGIAAELSPRREAVAVATKLKGIAAKYDRYNRAIRRYAVRHGDLSDDVVDKRVVSRADDNYSYNRRRKDNLRF
jgi:t-SNARE complex subunit (syntaxin)